MKIDKVHVLVLEDIVIFPNTEIKIEYDNVYENMMYRIFNDIDEKLVLVVNPIEDFFHDITSLPNVGVLCRLKIKMTIPNNKTRLVIEGVRRVNIDKIDEEDKIYYANYSDVNYYSENDEDKYYGILQKTLERYISKAPYMSNAIISQIVKVPNLSDFCDLIGSYLAIDVKKKKKYITTTNPVERAKLIVIDINSDIKFLELERDIEQEVEDNVNDREKEYYIKERIKMLQQELGEEESIEDEAEKLTKKLNKLKCSNKTKKVIKDEINRLSKMPESSPEIGMTRDYINWMLSLPWNIKTKDNENLNDVKKILDSSHYGLNDVKDRILEFLAVKQNAKSTKSPILCFIGPPGVGKTSLAQSIAKALNRKMAKISVGGINDEAEIVGHRRTYIGSNPGRIIQGIKKAGSCNPVFIIDEIDKMTKDIKGDPASSLLEVLDPEQNTKFSDHYIEEEFDLSQVFFIATANYIEQIPYELIDRLEVINLSSYTEYEKLDIAKNYLLPKELDESGLTPLTFTIDDDALMHVIQNYTKEAGVRELDRILSSIMRKVVKEMLLNKKQVFYHITIEEVEKYLGKPKYLYMKPVSSMQVGIVNGMAYTTSGGDILPIEVTYFKGKGNLILTGSLGDVMQESCKIALSYLKSHTNDFDIDIKLLEENDVHIHFPEGAVNKDGPSAGIAITTALVSLFKSVAVDNKLSMTGEITLQGRVLPIGGLKEKIIGARRAGINHIIVPNDNKVDIDEIPDEIKKDINITYVKNYKDVYKNIF